MQNIHTWKFVGCQTYLVVYIDNKCSKNLSQCPGVCFIVPSRIKKNAEEFTIVLSNKLSTDFNKQEKLLALIRTSL